MVGVIIGLNEEIDLDCILTFITLDYCSLCNYIIYHLLYQLFVSHISILIDLRLKLLFIYFKTSIFQTFN
jgi:hypothetical protein